MGELQVQTIGHVRVLRLDRPERKNALTSSLGWSIVNAVADAGADDDVRVVAITGNGDAFCSGLDLGGGNDTPPDTRHSDQQRILDEKGWVGRFLLARPTPPRLPAGVPLRRRRGGCAPWARVRGRARLELEERLLELCAAVASQAPLAVQRTKRLVARTPLVTDVAARAVEEIRNALAGLDSEDGQEAVRAIMEKRSPEFRGR